MTPGAGADDVVEAVFSIQARTLPLDPAQPLQQALVAHCPWLALDAGVGIHPLKLMPSGGQAAMVSQRTRLILRVNLERAGELCRLSGVELDVAGHPLRLGDVHVRKLTAHATVYAYRVAAESADEAAFMQSIAQELAAVAIVGERVCGKRNQLMLNGGVLDTFSLMVHGLAPEQSLRLQMRGLGPHRLMGCGVFVPHKSAAAVGV